MILCVPCKNLIHSVAIPPAPTAPPQDIKAFSETSESIRVVWSPPPLDHQNGDITHYMLMYVNSTLGDDKAHTIKIQDPTQREHVISDLQKWTEYRLWMMAGTLVGDGVKSDAIMVRTDEDGELHLRVREMKGLVNGTGE